MFCMISFIWHSQKDKTTVIENTSVVTSGWEEGRIWLKRSHRMDILGGATIYTLTVGLLIQIFTCVKIYNTVHTKESILLYINLWKYFWKNVTLLASFWPNSVGFDNHITVTMLWVQNQIADLNITW